MFDIRRRKFITLLGCGAVAWPLAGRGQQPAMPRVGFLSSMSPGPTAHFLAAFRRGLEENHFIEGQNVAIEYRWAMGFYDRLPALAADLVGHQLAVLVAVGGPVSGRAAKAATSTIPIVFVSGDAVRDGLVQSLNRPGGNATGVSLLITEIEAKRLGLLRELVPTAMLIAVLLNPTFSAFDAQLQDLQQAARALGQRIHILRASHEAEIDAAFATAAQVGAGAVLVAADPFLNSRRDQIVALAARHAIPAIYESREYAVAGGLMSYGVSIADAYRQVGIYTGRILKGEKPIDLPVMQSSRFEFVINLKTAQALGLSVPNSMQLLADEVIE
jgi:putative ABC transport system substrate-binding protein